MRVFICQQYIYPTFSTRYNYWIFLFIYFSDRSEYFDRDEYHDNDLPMFRFLQNSDGHQPRPLSAQADWAAGPDWVDRADIFKKYFLKMGDFH